MNLGGVGRGQTQGAQVKPDILGKAVNTATDVAKRAATAGKIKSIKLKVKMK